MRKNLLFFSAAFWVLFLYASDVFAGDARSLNVNWSADYTALDFEYLGKHYHYPIDMMREDFPPQGAQPVIEFQDRWPVVAMRARWTITTAGWPEKYRPEAIDLILMFATSAELYEHIYPDSILSSSYTYPPEFMREAVDSEYRLAETLRGKEVAYKVTASGGFLAKNYEIVTKMRLGLSQDGKTIFYFDKPDYISDYLEVREFLFAGRDEGDEMHFEILMLCVSKPRGTFRGEAMNRIRANGEYFVGRLYGKLDEPPTAEAIERFFALIKKGPQETKTLLGN